MGGKSTACFMLFFAGSGAGGCAELDARRIFMSRTQTIVAIFAMAAFGSLDTTAHEGIEAFEPHREAPTFEVDPMWPQALPER